MQAHDVPITQRGLVGRRLRLVDGEVVTKYVFPFVDGEWRVPFAIVDILGRGPTVLAAPIEPEGADLRSAARLADLRSAPAIPLEAFLGLAHFDLWWVFRGIPELERPWVNAVISTNIAQPFTRDGVRYKIHDLAFPPGVRELTAVRVKDEVFHPREFRKGELDLLGLRRASP